MSLAHEKDNQAQKLNDAYLNGYKVGIENELHINEDYWRGFWDATSNINRDLRLGILSEDYKHPIIEPKK